MPIGKYISIKDKNNYNSCYFIFIIIQEKFMSYLIENNAFTNDSKGVRATRLYFLSHSIDNYAFKLRITDNK